MLRPMFAQRRQVQLIGLQMAASFVLAFGVGVSERHVTARPGHALVTDKGQFLGEHFKA